MSAIELLPCPFCGSHGIDRELTRLRQYPYCTNCGANGPINKKTWNDRTRTDLSQSSVAAALEAAADICRDISEAALSVPVERAMGRGANTIRAMITPDQQDALAAHVAAEVAKARAEDAAKIARLEQEVTDVYQRGYWAGGNGA